MLGVGFGHGHGVVNNDCIINNTWWWCRVSSAKRLIYRCAVEEIDLVQLAVGLPLGLCQARRGGLIDIDYIGSLATTTNLPAPPPVSRRSLVVTGECTFKVFSSH